MYVQVRDKDGAERFIEAEELESCILAGDVVAFRRSDGWIDISDEERRGGLSSEKKKGYKGQERRRALLGKHAKPIFAQEVNE